MADITDPEAVRFCNDEVRRFNDLLVVAYRTAKQIKLDYDNKGMGAIFTNNSDVVVDGSATDGRHKVTTFDVNVVLARANEIITDYEASSNTKLNQASAIAVSTNPLF